nr:MAG: hypothetical protein DIU80_23980 [Chloroflexota bacterium]
MLINNVDDTIDYRLRWQHAGIPQRCWDQTLDDLTPTSPASRAALRYAHEIVDSFRDRRKLNPDRRDLLGVGAAIVGPNVTDNTDLLCATLTDVHKRYGASIAYVRADRYVTDHQEYLELDANKAKREENEDRYRELLAQHIRLRKASLLGLDAIGQEHHGKSGYAGKVIGSLLRQRFDAALPTLAAGTRRTNEWTAYGADFPIFAAQALPETVLVGIARVA